MFWPGEFRRVSQGGDKSSSFEAGIVLWDCIFVNVYKLMCIANITLYNRLSKTTASRSLYTWYKDPSRRIDCISWMNSSGIQSLPQVIWNLDLNLGANEEMIGNWYLVASDSINRSNIKRRPAWAVMGGLPLHTPDDNGTKKKVHTNHTYITIIFTMMEEILHQLGCEKPCK